MQQAMETEESMTGGQKKALSFDEVRSYLRNRTENATNPVVGALTLNDMRKSQKKNSCISRYDAPDYTVAQRK